MKGYPVNCFRLQGKTTRAEAVIVILNAGKIDPAIQSNPPGALQSARGILFYRLFFEHYRNPVFLITLFSGKAASDVTMAGLVFVLINQVFYPFGHVYG